MESPFSAIANELFKNQVKYKKGRYDLNIPFGPSARLNWIGSTHWALMQKNFLDNFGTDYFVWDYYSAKLWGHIFSSRVSSLVKTKRIMGEMMGLISEHLGFGKIEPQKLAYGEDWMTFKFLDSPISRESIKLFGNFKYPIDYSTSGLIAGSAERVLGRKFITFEKSCLGKGDPYCTFHTIGIAKAKKYIEDKIKNKTQKEICNKILELENKTDFKKLSDDLLKKENKNAIQNEKNY